MVKTAQASWEHLMRVFTVPEADQSTLARLEGEISNNIDGFLKEHIAAGDLLPEDIERLFIDTKIPDNPIFVAEQTQFLLRHVVAQSVHVAAPSFVGHMTSAMPYFMLPLAKIMIALNQNLVKIETSKAFTPLERQVLGMLHRLVFAKNDAFYAQYTHDAAAALGIFGSGGTTANIAALWVARNQLLKASDGFPGVRAAGLLAALKHYNYDGLAFLVSERGHYSLKKAADLLGIGRESCLPISTDRSNRADMRSLKARIKDLKSRNIGILAVVGIAGTTETGHVDPLAAMADTCAEEGVFFHVDAAWGGPTLLSEKHRGLLKGIEAADSVTFDAHKQLYVPVGAGMVLFKEPKAVAAIENNAHYIVRKGSRDLGRYTLEGSRPGMAMLVHSSLRVIGRKGFAMLIDHGIGLAKEFAAVISGHASFQLMTEPELNLLCYRYCPAAWQHFMAAHPDQATRLNERINDLTIKIQKTQRSAGQSFVSRTTIPGHDYDRQDITVFRVVLANPLTNMDHLAEVLNEQMAIAEQLPETAEIGDWIRSWTVSPQGDGSEPWINQGLSH